MDPPEFWLPERLTWRELDGDWLVYQHRTGLCVALEPVAAAVVGLLEEGPVDATALSMHLVGALELPPDLDVGAVLDNVLMPLCRAGLVSRRGGEQAW